MKNDEMEEKDKSWYPDTLIMPIEIMLDKTLSFREIHVLFVCYSWRKKNTTFCNISREMISERSGYDVQLISKLTRSLQEKGWVRKIGNGGRSQWLRYELLDFNSPKREEILKRNEMKRNKKEIDNAKKQEETVYDLTTNGARIIHPLEENANDETVYDLTLNGVQIDPKRCTNRPKTVYKLYTRIDTEKDYRERLQRKITERGEIKSKSNNLAIVSPPLATSSNLPVLAKKPISSKKFQITTECPVEVDDQLWEDFIILRKAKDASITPTVIRSIEREAVKAGISIAEAIEYCCMRNWQGFNASWYRNGNKAFGEKAEVTAESIMKRSEEHARRRLANNLFGDMT